MVVKNQTYLIALLLNTMHTVDNFIFTIHKTKSEFDLSLRLKFSRTLLVGLTHNWNWEEEKKNRIKPPNYFVFDFTKETKWTDNTKSNANENCKKKRVNVLIVSFWSFY